MAHVAENLRYLLWREGVPREKWHIQLAEWLGSSLERAKNVLTSGNLRPDEQAKIAKLTGFSEEEVQFTRLLEGVRSRHATNGVNILTENLRFLIAELDHGKRKQLAESIGVSPNSISRWASGRNKPTKAKLLALSRYFGLSDRINLETVAIFLNPAPVSIVARKQWLHDQIEAMEPGDLQALFPALKRLFGDERGE
jgi:transcriptional regulator with XRE-family HTH domain